MNISEYEIIKGNILGQLVDKTVAPLAIAGKPGTGKSTSVFKLAKDLDMNIIDISGASVTTEFMTGLPNDLRTEHMDKYSLTNQQTRATVWSIPEIIYLANTAVQEKKTILLLDDFHLANQAVQPYFFKLLLQRQLGDFKLDDNVVIILTINDSEEAQFNGFNSALRNRMAILEVEFDFEYWLNTFGKYLDYRVVSFLKAHPQHIQGDESVEIEGYETARAWTSIANSLKYYTNEFVTANAKTIAQMQVSKSVSLAFQKHITYINSINFEGIVSSRTITNTTKLDPLDAILYSYIVNFINTVEDGAYLLEFIDNNIKDSTFIGFLIAELGNKYSSPDTKLSDGLDFAIKTIVNQPLSKSTYKCTDTQWKKATSFKMEHADEALRIASSYLI